MALETLRTHTHTRVGFLEGKKKRQTRAVFVGVCCFSRSVSIVLQPTHHCQLPSFWRVIINNGHNFLADWSVVVEHHQHISSPLHTERALFLIECAALCRTKIEWLKDSADVTDTGRRCRTIHSKHLLIAEKVCVKKKTNKCRKKTYYEVRLNYGRCQCTAFLCDESEADRIVGHRQSTTYKIGRWLF